MKYRRFLAFVISAILLITAVPVAAEDHVFTIEDGVLTDYSGPGGEVVIPEGITMIGNMAFYLNDNITNIIVPEGVTEIGEYAFAECSIRKLSLPNSLISIGAGAFLLCQSLKEVTIPDSVTYIGKYAFSACRGLKEITIPSGVTTLADGLFSECWNLEQINLHDGITEIGSYVFGYNKSLIKLDIPDSVKWMGGNAFVACINLKEIKFPKDVQIVGDFSVRECESITEINIPESVKGLDYFAFSGCKNLIELDIPFGMTNLYADQFYDCHSLISINVPEDDPIYSTVDGMLMNKITSSLVCCPAGKSGVLDIPEGVIYIYAEALQRCQKLTDINLPASMINYFDPFGIFCYSNVVNINVSEDNPVYSSKDGVLFNKTGDALVYYPPGRSGTYIVPEGVKTICEGSFADSAIQGIIMSDSVTEIESYAFDLCFELTKVEFSQNLKSIDGDAFKQCDNLRSVVIPESVEYIYHPFEPDILVYCYRGSYAEEWVKSEIVIDYICIDFRTDTDGALTKYLGNDDTIIIPKTVRSIKEDAFKDHDSLSHITVSASVKEIADGAIPLSKDLVICTSAGSSAETFALQNGIKTELYIPGDTDNDKVINLTDVSNVIKSIADWDVSLNLYTADVNADGAVNLGDVSHLLKYVAKWDVELK